ncbi:1-like peptide receptor [Octopus vulgaris]|uniref:1-like peptide receptor n=1 Tax=Octopus vulgaris TaxID=6645 RepID=A0AA36BMD4_OCTVU|nr:1-like peptide receptor [Octopus vulgaris]
MTHTYDIPVDVYPVGTVYLFTLLLGMVGNSLVIFCIVKHKGMRSITNIFLLSLACADLLLVLICVPVKGIAFFSFTWTMGYVLCKMVHYVQNVSMICSVMTLTMMSVERYIAIRYPLKAKYLCTLVHAKIVIFCTWFLSLFMAIPILFGQQLVEVGYFMKGYLCIKEWSTPEMSKLYELYMFFIMLVIPTCVMIVAYSGIYCEMVSVTARRADMRTGSLSECSTNHNNYKMTKSNKKTAKKISVEDDKTKMQVLKMLAIVVLLFVLCWAPILINNVLVGFEILPVLHYGHTRPVRMAFHLMSYFNSCINPVVYSFLSRNFRESFKHIFRNLCNRSLRPTNGRERSTRRSTVSFTTRSTSFNQNRRHHNKNSEEKLDHSNSSSDNVKVTIVSCSEDA